MSIEQKIAELLAESKKLQQEDIIEEEAVQPVKGEEEPNVKKNNTDQTVRGVEDTGISATTDDDNNQSNERKPKGGNTKHADTTSGKSISDAAPVDQSKERLPEEFDYLSEEEFNALSEEEQHAYIEEVSSKKEVKPSTKKKSVREKPSLWGKSPAEKELEDLRKMIKKRYNEDVDYSVDVSEDVAALVNGEDLTEEFKTKAATIFEAAVITRVKEEISYIEEQFDLQLQEQVEEIKEGLIEKVDGYLNYVVEQWMEQNELALESGIKSEIVENFISGMKGLFEQHYIDIPEEKYDVLGDMEETIASLEEKLNEQVETAVTLTKELNSMKRESVIAEAANGLADTDVEKFEALAEELSFEDVESFSAKLQTIRENYFGKKATSGVQSVVTDEPVQITEEKVYTPLISAVMQQLNSVK